MIVVNGHEFTTLDDDFYVNGKKVIEAYADGQLVYPERLPYTLKFRQDMNCHVLQEGHASSRRVLDWNYSSIVRINSLYPIEIGQITKTLPASETIEGSNYTREIVRSQDSFVVHMFRLPRLYHSSSTDWREYPYYEMVWSASYSYNYVVGSSDAVVVSEEASYHSPIYYNRNFNFGFKRQEKTSSGGYRETTDYLPLLTLDGYDNCLTPIDFDLPSGITGWDSQIFPQGDYYGGYQPLFNANEIKDCPLFDGRVSGSFTETNPIQGVTDYGEVEMASLISILEDNNT